METVLYSQPLTYHKQITNTFNSAPADNTIITIPSRVLAAARKLFPAAIAGEWRVTEQGHYSCQFMGNGMAWEATFEAEGAFLNAERCRFF